MSDPFARERDLGRRIEQLEAALTPFVKCADSPWYHLMDSDIKRAREALATLPASDSSCVWTSRGDMCFSPHGPNITVDRQWFFAVCPECGLPAVPGNDQTLPAGQPAPALFERSRALLSEIYDDDERFGLLEDATQVKLEKLLNDIDAEFPASDSPTPPDKPPEDAATVPPLPEGEGAGSCPACAPHYWINGIPDRWKFCPMCAKPLSRTMEKHPDQRGTIAQMDAAMDTIMMEGDIERTAARLRAEIDLED